MNTQTIKKTASILLAMAVIGGIVNLTYFGIRKTNEIVDNIDVSGTSNSGQVESSYLDGLPNPSKLSDTSSGSAYISNPGILWNVHSSSGMTVRNLVLMFSGMTDGKLVVTEVSYSWPKGKESILVPLGGGRYSVAQSGTGTKLPTPLSSFNPNIAAIPVIFTAIEWKKAIGGILSVVANGTRYELKIDPK